MLLPSLDCHQHVVDTAHCPAVRLPALAEAEAFTQTSISSCTMLLARNESQPCTVLTVLFLLALCLKLPAAQMLLRPAPR